MARIEACEQRIEEIKSRGMEIGDEKVVGWQRDIPHVTPFATPNGMSSTSAAEVLLTSVNRGEMQGGLWSWEDTGSSSSTEDCASPDSNMRDMALDRTKGITARRR
mmetsp:Transcript_4715/g.8777  ORF Transcript_4715/g.8777 Transcript_4715/m.8777 type:complete len:106 (-) Transcript_4715:485-802(-)